MFAGFFFCLGMKRQNKTTVASKKGMQLGPLL